MNSFRQLVRAFYDLSFSFREFLQVYPHLNSLIVDTLVGNVFTDLTPLFNALEEYKAKNPRTGDGCDDGLTAACSPTFT